VRAARKGDEPALAALSSALGYPADAGGIERRLSVLAAGADDVVFVAVTESAEVVGFVHVAERRLLVSAWWHASCPMMNKRTIADQVTRTPSATSHAFVATTASH